jgi:hypothetical protein
VSANLRLAVMPISACFARASATTRAHAVAANGLRLIAIARARRACQCAAWLASGSSSQYDGRA